MFREMRRKRQLMAQEDAVRILTEGSSGVLAVQGDDGYPYTVPVSYLYCDGRIYFHGAGTGHKIDAIRRDDKVSFCVIGMDQNVPEKFTTYFHSVVAFGRASVVSDEAEKRRAIELLADKYSPNEPAEKRDAEIEHEWTVLTLVRIDIEHLTGKQAIELVK